MISFVLLMGGSGSRLKIEAPKQFIKINGKELFEYSLIEALKVSSISHYVFVCPPEYKEHVQEIIFNYNITNYSLVIGGKTRQESVFNALKNIKDLNCEKVLIHDASRPLVKTTLIKNMIEGLNDHDAIIPIVPIHDSIIDIKSDNNINSYKNRDEIFKVQTPQAFKFDIIYKAHLSAYKSKDFSYTDDASIALANGVSIQTILSDNLNFKITTNDDLDLFKKIIN